MIKGMAKENIFMKILIFMRANGRTIKDKENENLLLQMTIYKKGIGKMMK